ncbi:hypothetical protein A2873_02970 [Candidatus Woesebacteria bacterium RIFCSPHIGHO2_01_FULL_42_80]|nr:MAG: hypothetical protein A2873_02970 [Candidatus Woesebacteria bacterium RIFCSPHIGHO2_01_FULL_42_80]
MALRVGGGTRSATFETQSVFFRKESTHSQRHLFSLPRAQSKGSAFGLVKSRLGHPAFGEIKRKTQKF